MKSVWPKIPRVGVPRNDPRFVFKKGLLAALPAEVVPLESARDSLALVDLSGISEKAVPVFEKKWLDLLETKARVLTPSFADKAKWGKLPQSLKPFTGECHPLLSWTVAERIAAIRKNKISGRLVSFRLIWNVPGAASNGLSNRVEFEKLLLPELLLLSETLAGSEIKKIHFEISQKSALVFGLLTFENGVVGEWDVNAALPWTMEPMRFLHAYFTQGAVTNLPPLRLCQYGRLGFGHCKKINPAGL